MIDRATSGGREHSKPSSNAARRTIRASDKRDRPLLALVHGIQSKGEWYAEIQRVFGTHFELLEVHYPQFRSRFPVGVVFDGRALLVVTLLLTAGWWWSWPVTARILIAAVLASVGTSASTIRRHRALESVRSQLPSAATQRVSILAHSLGTYLVGRVLDEGRTHRARRVVMSGTVLTRRFDWQRWKTDDAWPLEGVWNEVARWDVAVWPAAIFGRLFSTYLGSAGIFGFSPGRGVHYVAANEPHCGACKNGGAALVHNHHTAWATHSRFTRDPEHAKIVWLPFLLGVTAEEFWQLRNWCVEWTSNAADIDSPSATGGDEVWNALTTKRWKWAKKRSPQTLRQIFEDLARRDIRLTSKGIQPSDVALRATHHFVTAFATAALELDAPLGDNASLAALAPMSTAEAAYQLAANEILSEQK